MSKIEAKVGDYLILNSGYANYSGRPELLAFKTGDVLICYNLSPVSNGIYIFANVSGQHSDMEQYAILQEKEYDIIPSPKYNVGETVNTNSNGWQHINNENIDAMSYLHSSSHSLAKIAHREFSRKHNNWWYKFNNFGNLYSECSIENTSEVKKDGNGDLLKTFVVGEWYTNPYYPKNFKYFRVGEAVQKQISSNRYWYNDLIFDAVADEDWNIVDGKNIGQANSTYEHYMEKVIPPEKKQKYLPDGHPDKMVNKYRFKVGDKVKLIGGISYAGCEIGETAIVKDLDISSFTVYNPRNKRVYDGCSHNSKYWEKVDPVTTYFNHDRINDQISKLTAEPEKVDLTVAYFKYDGSDGWYTAIVDPFKIKKVDFPKGYIHAEVSTITPCEPIISNKKQKTIF